MQLESSGDLLSRIYFLLIQPTEHLFLTSFNLTRALKDFKFNLLLSFNGYVASSTNATGC